MSRAPFILTALFLTAVALSATPAWAGFQCVKGQYFKVDGRFHQLCYNTSAKVGEMTRSDFDQSGTGAYVCWKDGTHYQCRRWKKPVQDWMFSRTPPSKTQTKVEPNLKAAARPIPEPKAAPKTDASARPAAPATAPAPAQPGPVAAEAAQTVATAPASVKADEGHHSLMPNATATNAAIDRVCAEKLTDASLRNDFVTELNQIANQIHGFSVCALNPVAFNVHFRQEKTPPYDHLKRCASRYADKDLTKKLRGDEHLAIAYPYIDPVVAAKATAEFKKSMGTAEQMHHEMEMMELMAEGDAAGMSDTEIREMQSRVEKYLMTWAKFVKTSREGVPGLCPERERGADYCGQKDTADKIAGAILTGFGVNKQIDQAAKKTADILREVGLDKAAKTVTDIHDRKQKVTSKVDDFARKTSLDTREGRRRWKTLYNLSRLVLYTGSIPNDEQEALARQPDPRVDGAMLALLDPKLQTFLARQPANRLKELEDPKTCSMILIAGRDAVRGFLPDSTTAPEIATAKEGKAIR